MPPLGFDMSGSFDNESDACLQSLRELFLNRVNSNKLRRMRQNEENTLMKSVSRVMWLTRIFPFMQLDDCLKLGQTCLFFNQLTRSPLFVKMQVAMNERTKIDVSLDTYGTPTRSPSLAGVNLFQSQLGHGKGLSDELSQEK